MAETTDSKDVLLAKLASDLTTMLAVLIRQLGEVAGQKEKRRRRREDYPGGWA